MEIGDVLSKCRRIIPPANTVGSFLEYRIAKFSLCESTLDPLDIHDRLSRKNVRLPFTHAVHHAKKSSEMVGIGF